MTVTPESSRRDSLQIINYFGIGATALQSDTARVVVEFNVLGAIERIADANNTRRTRLTNAPAKQSAVFVVTRTASGWRIVEAPRTMRVFAAAYLHDPTLPPLTDADRERLQRTLESH